MTKNEIKKLASAALDNLCWDGCLTEDEEKFNVTPERAWQTRLNVARALLNQIGHEDAVPSDDPREER